MSMSKPSIVPLKGSRAPSWRMSEATPTLSRPRFLIAATDDHALTSPGAPNGWSGAKDASGERWSVHVLVGAGVAAAGAAGARPPDGVLTAGLGVDDAVQADRASAPARTSATAGRRMPVRPFIGTRPAGWRSPTRSHRRRSRRPPARARTTGAPGHRPTS